MSVLALVSVCLGKKKKSFIFSVSVFKQPAHYYGCKQHIMYIYVVPPGTSGVGEFIFGGRVENYISKV